MSNMPVPAADVRAGFFRLPKVLFLDDRYRVLSTDAKVLYALMLDRMGLSVKNGWADRAGRVFIYFTLAEIRKLLGCGHCQRRFDFVVFRRLKNVRKQR